MQCMTDYIKQIHSEVYYVNLSNVMFEDILESSQNLANAKCVIFDARWGSKFNLSKMVPYFIDTLANSSWWNVPQIIYPNRKNIRFHKSNWSVQPKAPHFKSKIIVITAPNMISASETFMGFITHYNLATTVGGPTAGCNGNANWINLPCGYEVMWTGMKVLKNDGGQLKGFKPDYPVERTLQGVLGWRDEVLEKSY
jgi:hypothetical protein